MPVSTSFRKVPYSPVGDSFISSSSFVSSQYSKNLVAVPTPGGSTEPAAMMSMCGLKLWSSGSVTEPDRGIFKYLFDSKGWKVSGRTLYSFDSAGTQTSIGTIFGNGLVKMSANATTLLIVVPGSGAYTCDGSSVSSLPLSFTPSDLSYLNNQFIILDTDGVVRISNPGTTTFNSSNSFLGESQQDKTIAISSFNQFLMVMGESSIEPWENTGVGSPPFERMNGAIIEDVGIATRDCQVITKSALYLLGHDNIPYRIINFQAQDLVSANPGIAELFQSYDIVDAYLSNFQVFGQDIVAYHFPRNKKVWCFSEKTNLWFEVDHDVDNQLWLGQTSARLFGKWLVGSRIGGDIYELDEETYQNNSTPIVRERVFRPLSGESLSAPRDYFQMKSIEFNVETGVGVGEDNPQVIVSYSVDGGKSYGSESWLSLGELGDYLEFVEDYSNRKFKDLVVKVRYTENTRFTLGSAGIYIRLGGR